MRPYQIAATEKIINRIVTSTNTRKTGTLAAGGYIWHTTGSGKTLTSFKTAQLAKDLKISGRDVEKVLFVVDRKDLDYQTMKEYDRFEKGAANSNTSTKILEKQMSNPEAKIIITTIQKLDKFISRNKEHEVYQKHIVLIFDECHRSQFGTMHKAITKQFKNYHIFGFTGTPIFSVNSRNGKYADLKTTAQAFGGEPDKDGKKVLALHTYTIVDAIHDNKDVYKRQPPASVTANGSRDTVSITGASSVGRPFVASASRLVNQTRSVPFRSLPSPTVFKPAVCSSRFSSLDVSNTVTCPLSDKVWSL